MTEFPDYGTCCDKITNSDSNYVYARVSESDIPPIIIKMKESIDNTPTKKCRQHFFHRNGGEVVSILYVMTE
eukprot:CAMPEP_0202466634 /NCGR_PEP_ID=MMETSP1360-20130828/69344_1 /ASSEMBLY_ACC=CAM_ASM_000848 /TAXON_ID=515479 /ORGANISM="Licmophora paradoxa, Strain CCMP2313" /LENGTH=71 /DNA_ID=CAMNT_0049090843 /DNA_START=77 /DNA_END=292 /DNA_ORIENTATION=+